MSVTTNSNNSVTETSWGFHSYILCEPLWLREEQSLMHVITLVPCSERKLGVLSRLVHDFHFGLAHIEEKRERCRLQSHGTLLAHDFGAYTTLGLPYRNWRRDVYEQQVENCGISVGSWDLWSKTWNWINSATFRRFAVFMWVLWPLWRLLLLILFSSALKLCFDIFKACKNSQSLLWPSFLFYHVILTTYGVLHSSNCLIWQLILPLLLFEPALLQPQFWYQAFGTTSISE